jgi:hypothetical protein
MLQAIAHSAISDFEYPRGLFLRSSLPKDEQDNGFERIRQTQNEVWQIRIFNRK